MKTHAKQGFLRVRTGVFVPRPFHYENPIKIRNSDQEKKQKAKTRDLNPKV